MHRLWTTAVFLTTTASLVANTAGQGSPCPASATFYPSTPIGSNTSYWLAEPGGEQITLTASPAMATCCASGRIGQWGIRPTSTNTSEARIAQIAAACTDGSSVTTVSLGFNGTGMPKCNATLPGATFVPSIQATGSVRSNFTYKDAQILSYFLGVGDSTTDAPEQWFQCPENQAPVGIRAASLCYGITAFQIACDAPLVPAGAPSPATSAVLLPPPTAPSPAVNASQNASTGTDSSNSGSGHSGSSGISGGAIAGIVIGVLAAVALLAALWLFLRRRRRQPGGGNGAFKSSLPSNELEDGRQQPLWQQPGNAEYQQTEMSWSGRGLEKPKSPATTTTDYVKTVPASVATTDFVKTIPAKAHVSSGQDSIASGLSIDSRDMHTTPQIQHYPTSSSSNKSGGSGNPSSGSSAALITQPVSNNAGSVGRTPSSGLHSLPSDQIHLSELRYVCDQNGEPIVLGKGAYGKVLKGLLGMEHDIPVAIKAVQENTSPSQRKSLMQEATLLRNLRHSNIVTLFGACQEGNSVLLVMEELVEDLFHALHASANAERYLWRNRGQNIMLQIAEGLRYLHYRRIIHFDLKTSNVLLTHDGIAKLTDVGLSGVLGSKTHLSQEQGFTMAYAAPEMLLGRPCKASSDIYSLGVMMWELATGLVPERGRMGPLSVPEQCSQETSDLIDRCLSPEPDERPTIMGIIQALASHPG